MSDMEWYRRCSMDDMDASDHESSCGLTHSSASSQSLVSLGAHSKCPSVMSSLVCTPRGSPSPDLHMPPKIAIVPPAIGCGPGPGSGASSAQSTPRGAGRGTPRGFASAEVSLENYPKIEDPPSKGVDADKKPSLSRLPVELQRRMTMPLTSPRRAHEAVPSAVVLISPRPGSVMGSPRTVRALSAEACDKRAELQSAEIQTLKKMLSESRTTFFSQLQACGQQKDAMIDHLTQSSEELQSELHERQKTVAKQVGRIHDLETALAVQTSQTEHLSKQTGHLISLLEALQEDVAEHQKTALRQANRVHELEVALAAQTSQRDHLARHADEQTNALEELRAELAAKQGTARRQALRMQELENAVAVQSSHMTVNDKPLQELQQMQMELRSKAERVQALEEFVEQQRTEIQTLNQHIDTLEDQAHTRNDVNKRLVDENTRLKGYVRLMKYSQDRPKSAIQDPPSQGLKTAAGEGASHGPWPAAPESPPPPGRTNGCHLLRSPLMTTEDLRGKQCSTDSTGFLLPPEETV